MQGQAEQISLWLFLRTSRLIQGTLLIFIVIGLVSGGLIEVALPALVHGPLHGNASGYGIILAAWGAGALVRAIGAGALGKGQYKGIIILVAGLLMAALLALVPIWGIPGAIVCMLVAGFAGSVVNKDGECERGRRANTTVAPAEPTAGTGVAAEWEEHARNLSPDNTF